MKRVVWTLSLVFLALPLWEDAISKQLLWDLDKLQSKPK